MLVINFRNLSIVKVYRLLADQSSFTCLAVNDAFCVTGSNDGYLRLWPLDFDGPFMEAGKMDFLENLTDVTLLQCQ